MKKEKKRIISVIVINFLILRKTNLTFKLLLHDHRRGRSLRKEKAKGKNPRIQEIILFAIYLYN